MQHAEVQTQLLGIRVAQSREGREGHNLFKDGRLKTGFREEVPFSFFVVLFICLFLAVLGLHCCMGFSLVAASRGYFLVEVHGLLIAMT